MATINIICRIGVDTTKWKNRLNHGFLLGFFLVLGLPFVLAFFLGIWYPLRVKALKLYFHHKGKNHRAALGPLIIEFLQRVFDLGINEAPLGNTATTMVEGTSK